MLELDKRARDLLLTLLSSDQPLSTGFLATHLGISARQVRYALRRAELWLKSEGVPLHSGPRGQMWVDLGYRQRKQLIQQLERGIGYRYVLSGEERVQYELIQILVSEQPLLIKQLEAVLGVSRTTIRRDLLEAAEWLKERGLALWTRPHVGVHYAGTELAYRRALVELLTTIVSTDKLITAFRSRGLRTPPPSGTLLRDAAWCYVCTLNLELAARQVERVFRYLQLTDSELVDLFLYLGIAARRVCDGHHVALPPEQVSRPRRRWALEIARRWWEEVATTYRVNVPEDEITVLAALVAGAKVAHLAPERERLCGSEVRNEGEITAIVNVIVDVAARRLHPFLRVDPLLVRGLTLHLTPVLERLRFGLPVTNPLAEEVRAMYPEVCEVATECSRAVERVTGVRLPADEVVFLAMHLGAAIERLRARPRRRVLVVCSEGIATAWLLVSRLRSVFPFVDVVDVMSVYELHNRGIRRLMADAIISTIDLPSASIPVLVVSPMLKPEDIARVSAALGIEPRDEQGSVSWVRDQQAVDLVDLLQAFKLKASAASWQDVTRQAGDLLVQEGIAESRYTDAMIALIRRHGPYMVIAPGIALLHALPQDGALRLGMALLTLRVPVRFGHASNDPVDLVFAFACTDTRGHLHAFAQLADVLDNPAVLQALRYARDPNEVQDLLRHALSSADR